MGLQDLVAQYGIDYIVQCEAMHFGFALLLGGSVFLASYLTLTILSTGWQDRHIYLLSLFLAFPFASFSHYIADALRLGM